MHIKAVYKIPEIKHAFFIVDSLPEFVLPCEMSPSSTTRTEYIAQILRSKGNTGTTSPLLWTLQIVSDDEFQMALKLQSTKELISPIPYGTPESLELLVMNTMKSLEGGDKKSLSAIPDKDVIEVFI